MIEDGNILKVSWHLKGFGGLFTASQKGDGTLKKLRVSIGYFWKLKDLSFLRVGFLVVFVKPGNIYVGGLYGRESSRSRAPGETKSCLIAH